ncbi:hypothetical protein MHU86_16544 [Fragilaria crotonensis]|nr:hypothetical protein MHU86_16544 [Fragilaria crotonensis]
MVPGRENKVADILSRDFALDDDEVTSLIRKHGSPFVPQNFRIILQPALISQIGDWLRLLKRSSCRLNPRQAQAAGTATHDSSSESESTSTLSPPVRRNERTEIFACSLPPFGTDGFARQPATDGNGAMSGTIRATSTVWLRPSGLTNLRAQSTTPPDASTPSGFTIEEVRGRRPGVAQQQAIPLEVIRKVRSWSGTSWTWQSDNWWSRPFLRHEVLRIPDVGGGRRTSVVRVDDVRFRKQDETLTTFSYEQTRNADAVTITYRQQRTETKERR